MIEKIILSCDKCSTVVDKPYVLYNPYRRYLPNRVRLLIISESPPPGHKRDFIYNLESRDRLRNVMSRILEVRDVELPEYLKNNGIFWSTAIKCRPLDKRYLEDMRKKCVDILRHEIELLRPNAILALGRVAWRSIDECLRDSPMRSITVYRHYHPLYLYRFRRDKLCEIRNLIIRILNIHNL